ncbi:MAG: hypothetical protein R3F30_06285 [Planctomycetota bacterium]
MVDWLRENAWILTWLFVISLGSLAITAIVLPIVIVRLPEDYFAYDRLPDPGPGHPWLWAERIARNLVGGVLFLLGIPMLIGPGQGLLTIFVALLLLDFPRKHALLRRVVAYPRVLRFLNRVRARRGRPPLRVDGGGPGDAQDRSE